MKKELDNSVQWLCGSLLGVRSSSSAPLQPFAEDVIEWLNALSGSLLKDPQSRQYPDIVTFAFFCRRANLLKARTIYGSCQDNQPRLGRGLVFHIAPSNVPVNFAYSLVAGLLAGNSNIVRVSQKQFPQVDLIVRHINALQSVEMQTSRLRSDQSDIANRIAVVRYPHESNANEVFSAICDVRVIWGGDDTIAKIRQPPLKPRAFDICFADRYSVAAIKAGSVLGLSQTELTSLAEGFYNDTYLFDQNACSAPHLVLWTGTDDNIRKAQEQFWRAVYAVVKSKYQFQEKMAVDKLTALYIQATAMLIKAEPTHDNLLKRVDLQELPKTIDEFRCACGYFSEYKAQSLDELAPIVTEKYQTLAYYGFSKDELTAFVNNNRLQGIDRIVPIGKTTDFSFTWDGMNLIERMSRIIDIQ